jgi:hypothetical protein
MTMADVVSLLMLRQTANPSFTSSSQPLLVFMEQSNNSSAASSARAAPAPAVLSKAHPSHPLLQEGQQVCADVLIGGVPTALLITSFSDRLFVAVTQLNKLGSFTLAATTVLNPAEEMDARAASGSDNGPTYSVQTLLGPRSAALPQLLARRLIESVSRSTVGPHMASKSLLLSLALRQKPKEILSEQDMQAVRDIVAEVEKIKMW